MDQPSVYQVPFLTKSCTNPKPGGNGHKTSLGKAGGVGVSGPPMDDTPHHGLFSYTTGETKKKKTENITPYVPSYQSKSISRRYIQVFPLGLKKDNNCCIDYRGKGKAAATAAMQHSLLLATERERRAFQTKPSPARAHRPQTTYPSLSLSPASGNLVNSLPSPTTGKFTFLRSSAHPDRRRHFIPRRDLGPFKLSSPTHSPPLFF